MGELIFSLSYGGSLIDGVDHEGFPSKNEKKSRRNKSKRSD